VNIAFFGSSLVSSWWNGACTYYRGVLRGLYGLGHRITFYEPVAYERQEHRDIDDPDYARVVVYPAEHEDHARSLVEHAAGTADVIVKASGVGVFDDVLEQAVAASEAFRVFWDVDAPATLARMEADPADPLRRELPAYDAVLTYGGGDPVVRRYLALGARECHVVYNGLDPESHYRVPAEPRFAADCGLLANRLPDREERVDEFFFRAAALAPHRSFLLAGNGWGGKPLPTNVRWIGHLGSADHNAFNCSPTTLLNVTRESMARNGWSPATRVFEVAGAGACLITDDWPGVEEFFEPGRDVFAAVDGADVARYVREIAPERAREVGARAAARAVAEHTYDRRAAQVDTLLRERLGTRCAS
jgi:spore maturation protein CgeB